MGEVYLWRGSAEQRASRSLAGKWERFTYFNHQLDYPNWRGKFVLDFGGNEGNILLDYNCTISPEKYYCLDVLKEALDQGRKRFPMAHWVHYNRYNCSFNPEGVRDLSIPEMGVKFHVILAYSVFTHTTREEMHTLVNELKGHLRPGGTLAFTFFDPHWSGNLRRRLQRTNQANGNVDRLVAQSRGAEWCTVVNGSELYVNSNGTWSNETKTCLTYDVYHTVKFMRREFPRAIFRPPLEGHMQQCCLIRNESDTR